jgi:RHH-type proline utilization regulon transcriptional repressor/proline dehydrogenase/delta 1-pyrroline-5-carboxylate dehydrogenase
MIRTSWRRWRASSPAAATGLTLGVHSRIEGFWRRVAPSVPAGNAYINRSIIGAVVGVQPFGGEGLSGHGPQGGRTQRPDPLTPWNGP